MFTRIKSIKWKKVPFEDASEKYSIEDISRDELSDLLPEEPEHFLVHKGDVTIDGPAGFGGSREEDLTVHVIDGNLIVNGPFIFNQADVYAVLYVTGSVTCDNAFVAWDAQLFVKKAFTVKGLLATYITDAGHFSIKGALSATYWLAGNDSGMYELHKKPKAKLLRASEDHYNAFNEEADDDEDEEDDGGAKFGFDAKAAVPLTGILHPSLIAGDADFDDDAFGEAIRKGKALLA